MQKSFVTLSMLLVTSIFANDATFAQNQDPIDTARAYPPTLVGDHETALAQIDWQLQRMKQTREKQLVDLQQVLKLSAESREVAKRLSETLPIELRFANQEVRAEMIGACLRELLSARLEVASNGEIISQLSGELAKAKAERMEMDQLEKQAQQLKIQAIETKFAAAMSEYEQNKKLFERGATSTQDLERSKSAMQITEYELAKTRLEMEVKNASRADEIAQRLIEARIEAQPVMARAAAAEKFLKLFSESDDTINKIEELDRAYQSGVDYSEEFNRRMWATSDQIAELESLKELIQSTLKAADAKKTSEANKD